MLHKLRLPILYQVLSGDLIRVKTVQVQGPILENCEARLGQGLGQGSGKVGARLDKKQGSGKVWAGKVWARFGQGRGKLAVNPMYFTLITPPSLSPASICTNQSHYHYLLPEPCPDLACPDLARILLFVQTLPRPFPNLAKTLPQPCPNLAPTLRRRSIKLPKSLKKCVHISVNRNLKNLGGSEKSDLT